VIVLLHDLKHRDFRRILIIKPSSFGDVIHALPVLNGLRERYPGAHISWLVANSCAGLLEGHAALDEVIRFDRNRFGRIGRSMRVSLDFVRFIRDLRARKFDLVVDLQGLFRSGFLAAASGAGVRLGFASAREFGWLFYTHRVPTPDREMHAVDRNYVMGGVLGFDHVPIRFELPVQAAGRASAERLLAGNGLNPGEAYVLMGPGTRWDTKIWPAKYFADLAQRVEAESHCRVVLIGMESEVAIAREVTELAKGRVINLAGKTNLPELIALVDGAAMVVMHDSGPMHLATALKKPTVAIYGPTSASRTGPYGRGDAVARLDLECSPCYLKKLSDCHYQHQCMRELMPADVMRMVSPLLENHKLQNSKSIR
jgi:heptosyltransferase I